jgi:hypothetical protein
MHPLHGHVQRFWCAGRTTAVAIAAHLVAEHQIHRLGKEGWVGWVGVHFFVIEVPSSRSRSHQRAVGMILCKVCSLGEVAQARIAAGIAAIQFVTPEPYMRCAKGTDPGWCSAIRKCRVPQNQHWG